MAEKERFSSRFAASHLANVILSEGRSPQSNPQGDAATRYRDLHKYSPPPTEIPPSLALGAAPHASQFGFAQDDTVGGRSRSNLSDSPIKKPPEWVAGLSATQRI